MAGPGMLSFMRTDKYCTKLADEILKLRGEKALMDFKIHVKDDVFPCTKFVMAVHSPMLRAMLASDMAEVAKQEIRLDHISKDIIQIILDYMHCEDVSFHKDQLMALIAAADYLQMTELKEMCLDEVPDILEPVNVVEWWKEAVRMNYDTIKQHCEEILAEQFDQISQQTDFMNLDLPEMEYCITNICRDTVDSDIILDSAMRWVSHKEQAADLEDILHKVHLNKCSAGGIQALLQKHETLLDKTPMVYKLLVNTLANVATSASKTEMVVIVGGQEVNTVNNACWKVSQSNEIEHLCDIPVDDLKIQASACVVPQGFVLTGGKGKRLCIMFIATKKLWVRLQNLIEQRHSHGSIYVKDVLYVLGGYIASSSDVSTDTVEMMMLRDGEWQNGPNLPNAVKFPKVSSIEEHLYLLDAHGSKELWYLDVDEEVWSKLAPLPVKTSLRGVSMTSSRGRLFVAGGQKMVCAWFDPHTNTWCTGQQPLQQHKYGSLVYHDDKLLLLGGSFNDGTDEVEEYDIDNDTWSVCSYKMPRKLCSHHVLVLDLSPV